MRGFWIWRRDRPGVKYDPGLPGDGPCITYTPTPPKFHDCPDCGISIRLDQKRCLPCSSISNEKKRYEKLAEMKEREVSDGSS